MNDHAALASDREARALQLLFGAIAARDQPTASRMLAATPALAGLALRVGASRDDEDSFFLQEIAHYAYAGDTALHIAAAAYLPGIARELVSRGANAGARNRRGAEPLHYAADGSPGSPWWNPAAQQTVVAFLIEAGANPNAEDANGVTPLHRAVRARCTPAVRALLAHGADALRKNTHGSTALHLAVQNTGRGGTGSAASREEQAQIIRLLLSHGARPSDRNAAGRAVTDCTANKQVADLLR